MKKFSLFVLTVAIIIISCKKEKEMKGNVTVSLDNTAYEYFSFSPDMNAKAALGRVLFYDKHLSINNSVACASCHQQQLAFADNAAASRGFENRMTKRNSMPIQNLNTGFFGGPFVGGFGTFFWDGRESNLNNLVARPITNHVEMGMDDLSIIPAKLAALPYYSDLFKAAYTDDEITINRISESVAMFMQSITSNDSRFDKAAKTNEGLTALELQGQSLFNNKYECSSCHNLFVGGYSGTEFMNIGLEFPIVDKGRGAIDNEASSAGKFKIPNLRNIARTAPYMHDGRFATLEDVFEHYSHNINDNPNLDERLRDENGEAMRMNISDQEKKALVAFLNTLTDYTMLTDPKYSSPFKTTN